ncbi:50S ribosomal protein L21 [compost metagenome]
MYAIIATGGKQIRVEEGRYVEIEMLDAEVDATVTFDQVLLVSKDGNITVGAPIVSGAKVTGKVLRHGKGPKVIVYKMRPKKHYRRKRGHRQPFTRVMIESISL